MLRLVFDRYFEKNSLSDIPYYFIFEGLRDLGTKHAKR